MRRATAAPARRLGGSGSSGRPLRAAALGRRPPAARILAAASSSSSSYPSPPPLDALDAEWRLLRKPAVVRAAGVRAGSAGSATTATRSELVERLNAALLQRDVFIITFGGGAGVYTLSSAAAAAAAAAATATTGATAPTAARETVLAFEGSDEAERYATLLEAVLPDGGPAPEVFALPRADVDAFCRAGGYALRLQPRSGGPLLLPPEATLRLMFDGAAGQQQQQQEARRWA